MDLPARASAAQAARALEQKRMELMYRGFDAMQIEEHLAMLRSASSDSAVRELKLLFILNTAADNLNVQVTEQEMNGRIMQMAMERGERPEKVRDQIIKQGTGNVIYRQIREHKVMDAILAKSKVTEQPFEDFKKDMETKNKK
jgi:trigger factor